LSAPDLDLLYRLALPSAYPVPQGTPNRPSKRPVPGTGPYRIASYEPGRRVRAVRDERFEPWAGAAQPGGYPDVIEWKPGSTGDDNVDAVEEGQADLYFDNPPEGSVGRLAIDYPGQLHINPGRNTFFLFLNTARAPFTSLAARRAVNYALDRRRAVALAGGPAVARPTCQVLPPNFPGYRRHCPYPFDLETARRLVTSSGTKGERVAVLTARGDSTFEQQARYAASVLRRLGYRVSVEFLPIGRYFEAVFAPRSRAQIGFVAWFADYASAFGFIRSNFSCGAVGFANASQLCDRSLDRAMKAAGAAEVANPQAAAERWAAIDRRITRLAPWVALYNATNVHFVSKRVGNYQYNPQWGVLLDQLWVK
jgi:peptide/nickel transport system substrate-binding protein